MSQIELLTAIADETHIKTKIRVLRHFNPNTGWFVAGTEDDHNVVGVSMTAPPVDVELTLVGKWQTNPKWGKQFRVEAIRYDSEQAAMLALLCSGFLVYVKAKMGRTIVEALGSDTFQVLNAAADGDSIALIQFHKISGVGPVTGPAILEAWRENSDWAESALICTRAGIGLKEARKLHLHFGDDLPKLIRENPYRLSVVRGVGWAVVDRIAQEKWPDKPAIPHDSPFRYAAAMRETLEQQSFRGHVCLPCDIAFADAAELAGVGNKAEFADSVQRVAEDEALHFVEIDHVGYAYSKYRWEEEEGIAKEIKRLLSASIARGNINTIEVLASLSQYTDVDLSEDQVAAVRAACESAVVSITGGPGTGKTTLIDCIANIMAEHGLTVTMCAPTGKASIRMTEATGRPASTIHRALGLPVAEDDFVPGVVIIDESSMIDQTLFHTVVKHVGSGTRLILVGDADQLPPVGPGEPFYQVLHMNKVPSVRLTQIHRQAEGSGIVLAARDINQGVVPNGQSPDCKIEYTGFNEHLPGRAIEIVSALLESGVEQQDVMLLTPLNGHPWGQQSLNLRLKAKYNPGLPDEVRMPGVAFDVGDPAIHIRNNYELGVMNGEVGRVEHVLTREEEREAPPGVDGELPNIVSVRYGDRVVDYDRDRLMELKLARAITVHKSQGSECPHVVLLMPSTRPSFQLRALAYTGLTRAKRGVHVLSGGRAFDCYVKNTQRARRYTNLAGMARIDG